MNAGSEWPRSSDRVRGSTPAPTRLVPYQCRPSCSVILCVTTPASTAILTELGLDLVEQRNDLVLIAYVGDQAGARSSFSLDVGCELVESVLGSPDRDDVVATGREAVGQGRSDAVASGQDERNAPRSSGPLRSAIVTSTRRP